MLPSREEPIIDLRPARFKGKRPLPGDRPVRREKLLSSCPVARPHGLDAPAHVGREIRQSIAVRDRRTFRFRFVQKGAQRTDGLARRRQAGAALETALGRLSEEQMIVVVLRLLRGIPFAEIAELVGQSEATCKMRFARGIYRIRKELEDEGTRP